VEYPFPKADFTISAPTVDSRHNQITCMVPNQNEVQYVWDMGDGSKETGPTIQHAYNVSNSLFEYAITLSATSKYDCVSSSSKTVEIIPFVPNVFSPNGDGVNDVFMPQIDLQIFDRYGKMLYNGTSGWDGIYQGRLVDPDTYFYLIHYKDRSQQLLTKKGSLTLLR
jgi:gliding motility-associated-like protein